MFLFGVLLPCGAAEGRRKLRFRRCPGACSSQYQRSEVFNVFKTSQLHVEGFWSISSCTVAGLAPASRPWPPRPASPKVVGLVRPGYLIGDEVLRPAQVAVAGG